MKVCLYAIFCTRLLTHYRNKMLYNILSSDVFSVQILQSLSRLSFIPKTHPNFNKANYAIQYICNTLYNKTINYFTECQKWLCTFGSLALFFQIKITTLLFSERVFLLSIATSKVLLYDLFNCCLMYISIIIKKLITYMYVQHINICIRNVII